MTPLFNIELTINMPDSGRQARQLLNLYFADMVEEIDSTALALCEADLAKLTSKFANLTSRRANAWKDGDRSLKVFVLLSVSGEEAAFIRQVITQYMAGFPERLKQASEVYFPHASFPPGISLQPTDWSVELHQV